MRIYKWEAIEDPDGNGDIEVKFHLQGINKPEAFTMAFDAGKSVVEKTNPNIFGLVMDLGMFLYGCFKKSK